jgi:galactose mutarotase-like enzyme
LVERAWTDEDGDHLRASITTDGFEGLLAEFPIPFRLDVTYTLHGTSLRLDAAAKNLGGDPMPFGFGIHPYVQMSLDLGARPEDHVAWADVTHASATGRIDPTAPAAGLVSTPGAFDLRAGRSVGALLEAQRNARAATGARGGLFIAYAKCADLAELAAQPGEMAPDDGDGDEWPGIRWTLAHPRPGVEVAVETSAAMRALVLYAPPEPATVISPVISSCLPETFDLASRGLPSGLLELAPGATWNVRAQISVRWR